MSRMRPALHGLLGGLLLLAGVAHAGTRHYYYTDPQGTVLAKADAQGNIIATYDYAPYGSQALGTAPNGPGYTGHVNDPDTGLVYMQARYYDPGTGKFISTDPVGPSPGNLFHFNRYDYAKNNPINYIDPNGEATVFNYPDKKLIIVVQTFKNTGSQFSEKQISSQGSSLSGKASDGTMVRVILKPGNDSDAVKISANPRLDDTSPDVHNHSHTDKIGGRDVELAPNARGPGTVAHEIGHVLVAGDQYKDGVGADGKTVKETVPGPANLMRDGVGPANQQTIDEIQRGSTSSTNRSFTCHSSTSGNTCQ